MRLVSWNILDGGVNQDGNSERRAVILDVIQSLNADIVVLQEANGFDDNSNAVLNNFSSALRLTGRLSLAGTGFHVTTFFKPSLHVGALDTPAGLNHTASVSRFDCSFPDKAEQTTEMILAAGHLSPSSGSARQTEASTLARLRPTEGEMFLVGDLNTIDDSDAPSLLALPPERRARYIDPTTGQPDSRPLRIIEAAGLVDVFALHGTRQSTAPTPLMVQLGRDDFSKREMTLDYCYATPRLAATCTAAVVLKNESTEIASDHYPLVLDFDIRLQRTLAQPYPQL